MVANVTAGELCGESVESEDVGLFLSQKILLAENNPHDAVLSRCVGYVYFSLGDFSKAEKYYRKALRVNKSEAMEAEILQGLASSIKYLGKYDEAIALLEKTLDIDKRLGNSNSRSQTYATLASIYGDKKDSQKSITMSLLSVDGLVKASDRSATYNNVGMAYFDMGDYRNAHFYIDMAIDIDNTHHLERYLGIHKINKGIVLQAEGLHGDAIPVLVSGVALVQGVRDQYWELQGYSALAAAYYKFGNAPMTIDSLRKAKGLARNLGRKADEEYFSAVIGNIEGLAADK